MARRKGGQEDEAPVKLKRVAVRSRASAHNDHEDSGDSPQKRRRRSTKAGVESAKSDTSDSDEPGEDHITAGLAPESPQPAATPASGARGRGRPKRTVPQDISDGEVATPSAKRSQKEPVTPSGRKGGVGADTPSRRTVADRSARRKSARALIDRVVTGATSDDEAGDEDLEREIYESSESEGEAADSGGDQEAEDDEDGEEARAGAATPSKTPRGAKRRQITRKKSPTPPRDLPPHERYFWQNKPGTAKTSNNTLASLKLLTHDEYFNLLRNWTDPHAEDVAFLQSLHAESFPQWTFELSQGFSVCLYGYGSKRHLLHDFAKHLHARNRASGSAGTIVAINGYIKTTTVREILATIASAIAPDGADKTSLPTGNPVAMADSVLALLPSSSSPFVAATTTTPSPPPALTLIVHSIDAPPLRKPALQALLARLAAHPAVALACSADTPDCALLWDAGQRAQLSFAFHDCTTFAPPGAAELDVVAEVHALLGRRGRRTGGREGVGFVLRSLPENARSLFRLLVGEVLAAMDDGGGAGGGSEELPGVEYRMLYNKAVEEFICSSEMAFRTLLKEFHDHQIITSRKDVIGTELLGLPFQRDELEAILEDLVD